MYMDIKIVSMWTYNQLFKAETIVKPDICEHKQKTGIYVDINSRLVYKYT